MNTNEIPKEAGFYMIRFKNTGAIYAGELLNLHNPVAGKVGPIFFRVCGDDLYEPMFHHYDWHRIELPEGWR